MKNVIIFIASILCCTAIHAQNVFPSNAFIETCYNKTDCYRIGNSSLIFLNNTTGDFLIQVDFNKFKIGNDTLDDWLNDLSKSHLTFKGRLNTKDLLDMNNYYVKNRFVNGSLSFNGISIPYKLELIFFRNGKEGSIESEPAQNYYNRIALGNLQIKFHAKDFKIGNREHHYKKTIRLYIDRGYINEWTSETNSFIHN